MGEAETNFAVKRTHPVFVTGFLICAGLGLLAGAYTIARQHRTLQLLARDIDQKKQDLGRQRGVAASTERELDLARSQLQQLPESSGVGPPDEGRNAEIGRWLARVYRIKAEFAQHPEQQIPELSAVSESSWLRVAREADLDSERGRRVALAELRTSAKPLFLAAVGKAVWPYIQAHDGVFPPNPAALAPYLKPGVDPAGLARYELLPFERPLNFANWRILEKAPVDAFLDSRYGVEGDGTLWFDPPPLAWDIELAKRQKHAMSDYARVHAGKSRPDHAKIEPLLPYFNPPLEPAIVEKILKAEREQKR